MFKKIQTVFMCAVLLLSFVACDKDETQQNNGTTAQTDVTTVDSISITEDITDQTDVSVTDDISTESSFTTETTSAVSSDEISPAETAPAENSTSVFETDNVERITFYAYYGAGIGSDVPDEHSDEIITWLNSFKIDIDREVPEIVPPGTNTIYVEFEYSDGSIVKRGMDITDINGVKYYISGDTCPECYNEIISKTSLS